jgi:hypothetical protein
MSSSYIQAFGPKELYLLSTLEGARLVSHGGWIRSTIFVVFHSVIAVRCDFHIVSVSIWRNMVVKRRFVRKKVKWREKAAPSSGAGNSRATEVCQNLGFASNYSSGKLTEVTSTKRFYESYVHVHTLKPLVTGSFWRSLQRVEHIDFFEDAISGHWQVRLD